VILYNSDLGGELKETNQKNFWRWLS